MLDSFLLQRFLPQILDRDRFLHLTKGSDTTVGNSANTDHNLPRIKPENKQQNTKIDFGVRWQFHLRLRKLPRGSSICTIITQSGYKLQNNTLPKFPEKLSKKSPRKSPFSHTSLTLDRFSLFSVLCTKFSLSLWKSLEEVRRRRRIE